MEKPQNLTLVHLLEVDDLRSTLEDLKVTRWTCFVRMWFKFINQMQWPHAKNQWNVPTPPDRLVEEWKSDKIQGVSDRSEPVSRKQG